MLLKARLIFEMFSAARANALESFLGHFSYVCECLSAGGIPVIHLPRKLLESSFDRFRRALLREKAGILVSIAMAFLSERLSTITPSLCHTVVLLPCVPITMVRVGK